MNLRHLAPADLVPRALEGDRRAVGRLLTLVARVVEKLIADHARPAVLAVDPSSPLSGGAILGDRVRMASIDATSFIRSLATRGHSGGLAMAVPGAVRVLDAGGYSPIIIETVGVGQVEVEVTAAADTTVVVLTPGMGDAVQANKAGLLEVGDIFVVNKCHQPGADDTRRDLELMLDFSHITGHDDPDYRPPILLTDAIKGDGLDALAEAIVKHRLHLDADGRRAQRRMRRLQHEIERRVTARLQTHVDEIMHAPSQRQLLADVADGAISPVQAAEHMTAQVLATAHPTQTAP